MAGGKGLLGGFTLAKYSRNIKSVPREMIFNKYLILSAMLFATAAVPQSKSPAT